MKHQVGPQGLIVPFGYVTTADGRVYQQGQAIPPGQIVVSCEGESNNDPARNTDTLMRLCKFTADKVGEK